MTTRINLLPWRLERRKVREREFFTMLGGAAIVGVLGVMLWSMITSSAVENQTSRNTYLTGEIAELDKRIEQIKELDKTKSRLIGRKNAIELLQSNRSQMVHLLDELVMTIPEGVRLTGIKQVGDQLTMDGIAESNTRVASYMRNIDRSPWMGRSELAKIENKAGAAGVDPRLPYQFSLMVKLLKAGEKPAPTEEGGANAAASPAPTDMAATPPKGPDLVGQLSQAGQTLVTQQQAGAATVPAAAPVTPATTTSAPAAASPPAPPPVTPAKQEPAR